jgi:hypothetical protein
MRARPSNNKTLQATLVGFSTPFFAEDDISLPRLSLGGSA